MQVNISGHQLEVTEPLRAYISEKLKRIEGHFDKITNVQVIMSVEKLKQKIEATLRIPGGEVVANAEHADMYAAIDLVTDKVESQIKRQVARVKAQRRHARNTDVDVFTYNLDADADMQQAVDGTDRLATKPLHLDEALMQLDSIGSEFLVFFNAENNRINVVYRTKVNGYALIDPVL